ncbi:MAG: GpE family phage tail protein [Pseudomonadota bacterium]|jgi:hypothetical protein
MADLAIVFHWQPQAMATMALAELMGWHAKAAERQNREG